MSKEDLELRLAELGPAGVFLRFVLAHTGRTDLFALRDGGVAGCGAPARVFVAASQWIFAGDPGTGGELLESRPPEAWEAFWVAPGTPDAPDGWDVGTDLVLVGPTRPSDTAVLSGDALPEERVHPELRHLLPPPPIRQELPFRFHGLERDGQIVAICDSTVDDGSSVALAQVHTASALRGRGLGTELVLGTLGYLHALGRQTAVWVCGRGLRSPSRAGGAAAPPMSGPHVRWTCSEHAGRPL